MSVTNSQAKTILSVLTEDDLREMRLVKQYGATDVYISAEEAGWHPWVNGLSIKPYRYETKNGLSVFTLWAPEATFLGKHRHRGGVTAVTIEGEWGYFEYDWVARPGDYVVENPGTIHTLRMGEGAKVVYSVSGSIEFFNENDSLRNTMDVFSFIDLYVKHCEATGHPVNERLFY
jgi:quercetin dioxygenase-like cupin family protein